MNKTSRAAWQTAGTLADLGELTARWLEGSLAEEPGYCGPSDIEDPALVPLLARLNRAGFVTDCSQIGETGDGWAQRAAVEGFASPYMASRLAQTARAAGLGVILHDPAQRPRWRYSYRKAVTVTAVNGRRLTGFGAQLPRWHIKDPHLGYGICHPDAVNAVLGAWRVTVYDPEFGRPGLLWDTLAGLMAQCGSAS